MRHHTTDRHVTTTAATVRSVRVPAAARMAVAVPVAVIPFIVPVHRMAP